MFNGIARCINCGDNKNCNSLLTVDRLYEFEDDFVMTDDGSNMEINVEIDLENYTEWRKVVDYDNNTLLVAVNEPVEDLTLIEGLKLISEICSGIDECCEDNDCLLCDQSTNSCMITYDSPE